MSDDSDRPPGGTTDGSGFSTDELGSDATAPMVQYDKANTGAASDATGPPSAPAERWSTEATLGSPTRPTALGETVFTNSINGICGFTAGGERRWAFDTNGSELNPTPVAVVGDRVYASRTSALFALDARTGQQRWAFTPPTETNRLTAPAVADETAYVVGQHPEQPPTVWAVATRDGSVQWRTELGGESAGPPILTDNRLYCTTTKGGLYAVDTANEAVSWQQSLPSRAGPPAATTDGVFVGTTAGVRCHNRDGSLRWRAPETTHLEHFHDGPVLDETTLYAGGPEADSLVALAVETGKKRWETPLSGEPRSPVVTSESVYVQDSTGELRALDRTDGSVGWTARLALRSGTGITVADGGVFVGADDKLLRYN